MNNNTTRKELIDTPQIASLLEGRELIDKITHEMALILQEMKDSDDNKNYKILQGYHYELRQSKNRVQSQMTRIFKESYKS